MLLNICLFIYQIPITLLLKQWTERLIVRIYSGSFNLIIILTLGNNTECYIHTSITFMEKLKNGFVDRGYTTRDAREAPIPCPAFTLLLDLSKVLYLDFLLFLTH